MMMRLVRSLLKQINSWRGNFKQSALVHFDQRYKNEKLSPCINFTTDIAEITACKEYSVVVYG